ncbi:MAG TPA: phosphate ABC transporter permease PstA [Methanosphaera sp.]|nr:phosphate ABC transporter permease PstA [Methanosphaera sp.]
MNTNKSDKLMEIIFSMTGAITILILLIITGYILIKGMPHMSLEFLLTNPLDAGENGGIFPMIVSTVYVSLLAVIFATPISLFTAIYLNEYNNNNKILTVIHFCLDILTSLPSIVYGLFGLVFFVEYLHLGWCILSAALTLAIMIIPTITRTTEVSIARINKNVKESSMALGASKWQTVKEIIIPSALPGILTGILLGLGRSIQETAVILFTVGSSLFVPFSSFDPGRPLTLHLYILATEGISLPKTYATAGILIIMIFIITIATNVIIDKYEQKIMGE